MPWKRPDRTLSNAPFVCNFEQRNHIFHPYSSDLINEDVDDKIDFQKETRDSNADINPLQIQAGYITVRQFMCHVWL